MPRSQQTCFFVIFFPDSGFISLLVGTTSGSATEHNKLWETVLLLLLNLNILMPFGLVISLLCIYSVEMCAQVQQKSTKMMDALALRQNPNAT